MSLLEEMMRVMLDKPGAAATLPEIAAWYERKANLLDRIAREGNDRAMEAEGLATTARAHARQLLTHLT